MKTTFAHLAVDQAKERMTVLLAINAKELVDIQNNTGMTIMSNWPSSPQPKKPEQEPKCNPHPKAPHGFNRNASHANDRYTCECEGWDAYDAGYQAGVLAGIEASTGQEPEQEPVIFLKEWSDWRDMVVVNIMRHGSIDKHLARELANHFQSMTPQVKEAFL